MYEQIANSCPETDAGDVEIVNGDKDATYLAVLCMKADAGAVEDALRAAGFAETFADGRCSSGQKDTGIKGRDRKAGRTDRTDIEEEIRSCQDERDDLKIVGDYFRMRAKKYEILQTLPQSQRTFVISGYIPKKAVGAVEKAIGDHYDCVIDVDDLKEDEEPPTVLQNNAFSSSVEGVLEAYGLPHKGEVRSDHESCQSSTYVFFGMMLSDAAYGATDSHCLLRRP